MNKLPLVSLYAAALALIAAFAWSGRQYYAAPLDVRPRLEQHWDLKPGGRHGLAFGIAGASMMTLMLGYSARKRLGWLRRAGPMSTWLNGHIFLGVVGPLLIVLHTALKVGGLVAVSFWAMVAVALSGVFGRYLYGQLPRSAAGDELSLEAGRALEQAMTSELGERFGLSPAEIAELDRIGRGATEPAGLLAIFVRLPFARLVQERRLRDFCRRASHVPRPLAARFAALVRQRASLRRRLAVWHRLSELFHYWHVAHKPFAILMYLFMVVHIAVAWMTGYTATFE